MIVIIKHFYETNAEDFAYFDSLWKEQEHRMIFLQMQLNETRQAAQISREINADPSKDILAIRFSTFIERNSIFRQIKNGIGFSYAGKTWYPTEVWVYENEREVIQS
jgi:hypothetical protein